MLQDLTVLLVKRSNNNLIIADTFIIKMENYKLNIFINISMYNHSIRKR